MACWLACFGAALATPAAAAQPSTAAVDGALAAELQGILDAQRAGLPLVGLSAAVVLADGSRWEGGSGVLEHGAAKPFLPSTPSVVGSITKTFVTALVLQLVEEGRFTLRTRLSRWFPEYSFASRVRIKHLLRHTSGLPDYFTTLVREQGVRSSDALLEHGRDPGLGAQQAPLLARIGLVVLEHQLPVSRSDCRARHRAAAGDRAPPALLRPARPGRHGFQGDEVAPSEAAYGYLLKNGVWKGFADGTAYRTHTSAATVAWAAGGIASSARDVAKVLRSLGSGSSAVSLTGKAA